MSSLPQEKKELRSSAWVHSMEGVIWLNLFSDSLRAVNFFNIDHKVVHNTKPTCKGDSLPLSTILNLPEQNVHFFIIF